MLKVNYKSSDGRFSAQFDGDTPNQVFEQLSMFQEVFEKHNQCGLCQSPVYFQTRKVEKSKFFEKKCSNVKCGACLTYHINDGNVGLYTTWNDKWTKYVPKPKDEVDEAPTKKGK